MRLLLLNINYLRLYFYQNHAEKNMHFNTLPVRGNPLIMPLSYACNT